jgi:hypothetical protein
MAPLKPILSTFEAIISANKRCHMQNGFSLLVWDRYMGLIDEKKTEGRKSRATVPLTDFSLSRL